MVVACDVNVRVQDDGRIREMVFAGCLDFVSSQGFFFQEVCLYSSPHSSSTSLISEQQQR
ncbi:hypothetical protein E2C01_048200 [Portunus trituberculatus]|uniref:Uncharacterized protein n=1 Tax=Portunus trituberculatus TaxID=210409 RepID=A0A5B7G2I9_PORTR|nr:hypothetical protein [Portunus trituberculatus]